MGGGELGLLELAGELDHRGLQPVVAVPGEGDFADAARDAKLDVRIIPEALPDAARRLRPLAAEAELVHATGARGLMAAFMARAHKPLIWHVRVASRDKMDPFLMRLPDLVIANSRATAQRFAGRARVRVIYNGVREPRPAPIPLPLLPDSRRIGVIGRMTPEKGHLDLVPVLGEVLERRSDIQIVFAGDDSGRIGDAIRAFADSRGPSVLRLGVVDNMADHVGELDLVVIPSLVEGFSRVAAEALRSGVNVLARRVGGLIEVLSPLSDPWLPDDRRSWADAIIRELDSPSHTSEELKGYGARFDPGRHADGVVQAYESLVRSSPPA